VSHESFSSQQSFLASHQSFLHTHTHRDADARNIHPLHRTNITACAYTNLAYIYMYVCIYACVEREKSGGPLSPDPVEIQRPPKLLILKNQKRTELHCPGPVAPKPNQNEKQNNKSFRFRPSPTKYPNSHVQDYMYST